MKKSLPYVFGLLALTIGIPFSAHSATQPRNNDKADEKRVQEGTAATNEAIKAITAAWDPEALKKRAHPTLLSNIKKSGQTLEDYFAALGELGAPKQEIKCQLVSASLVIAPSHFALMEQLCSGSYKNSDATIFMTLRQDDMKGPWQVASFNVSSPLYEKSNKPVPNPTAAPATGKTPAPDKPAKP